MNDCDFKKGDIVQVTNKFHFDLYGCLMIVDSVQMDIITAYLMIPAKQTDGYRSSGGKLYHHINYDNVRKVGKAIIEEPH